MSLNLVMLKIVFRNNRGFVVRMKYRCENTSTALLKRRMMYILELEDDALCGPLSPVLWKI